MAVYYEPITPSKIQKMTPSEINKEYSRLRSIANRRISRLNASGLANQQSWFPTIKQLKSGEANRTFTSDIGFALIDVSSFLRRPRTTVSSLKSFYNEFRDEMIERGYGDLVKTYSDIRNMINYMEILREQYSDKLFDSGDALDVLQEGQRLKIPVDKLAENYEYFATNLSQMEQLKPSKNGREFSQHRINNLIKKWRN